MFLFKEHEKSCSYGKWFYFLESVLVTTPRRSPRTKLNKEGEHTGSPLRLVNNTSKIEILRRTAGRLYGDLLGVIISEKEGKSTVHAARSPLH